MTMTLWLACCAITKAQFHINVQSSTVYKYQCHTRQTRFCHRQHQWLPLHHPTSPSLLWLAAETLSPQWPHLCLVVFKFPFKPPSASNSGTKRWLILWLCVCVWAFAEVSVGRAAESTFCGVWGLNWVRHSRTADPDRSIPVCCQPFSSHIILGMAVIKHRWEVQL